MFCGQLEEAQRRLDSAVVALTEAQQFEASECFERLAVRGRSLREATDFFLAHLSTTERSIPLADLFKEVEKAKEADGVEAVTLAPYRSRMKRFAEAHSGALASDMTASKIERWLRENLTAPRTRNNFRRDLRSSFAHALKHGYVSENPVVGVAKAKESDIPIEALTVQEVRALLDNSDSLILPLIALGCFAGIRPKEVARLDWSKVDFEHGEIDLRANVTKTASPRLVKMSDNLRAWLATCHDRTGPILPHDVRTRWENTRERAGLTRWPDDAARHSFASYHLACHQDAAALALQMGHSGTDLIFRHYRKVVTERDAAAYWNLYPEGPLPT